MNTQTKLFTGAVALALAASTVLTASSASARPYDDRYYDDDRVVVWEDRDRDDRYYDRDYRRFNRQLNRRNIYISPPYSRYRRGYYSNRLVRLPSGYRRVVYRDRVYYTRDNNIYYAYDNDRRDYFVVNLPGIRIGF